MIIAYTEFDVQFTISSISADIFIHIVLQYMIGIKCFGFIRAK